jgi:glycyl-tRNA synthetase
LNRTPSLTLSVNKESSSLSRFSWTGPAALGVDAGADRATQAFLTDAYVEEAERTVLRFHPRIAPIKAAVLPLVNKDGMPEVAEKLFEEITVLGQCYYDDKGAIGRRYRRQDEAGTPFCITIDGETAKDQAVTVRERDSMAQERVALTQVLGYLAKKIQGGKS